MDKNKKLKKAIKSFEKQIKIHKRKIIEYEGKDEFMRKYWGGEISGFKIKKEKLLSKLSKKRR